MEKILRIFEFENNDKSDRYYNFHLLNNKREIRKKKLLKVLNRFPKEYKIYKFEEDFENLKVRNDKWQISILIKEYPNGEQFVEIQLQDFPCKYEEIEEFLTTMGYNDILIKTYSGSTDVINDDILKKILIDFKIFDKKFNQKPEPNDLIILEKNVKGFGYNN